MRKHSIERNSTETKIFAEYIIDGSGKYSIDIPIGFLKHMLELFAKHGLFDISIKAAGDVEVDFHHTVEDISICLGIAFKKALGDMKGIKRYGFFILPMDESLAEVSIDICNRPFLSYNVQFPAERTGNFDVELVKEFFEKFVIHSGITLHINLKSCSNIHHGIEAVFKCFAKALNAACSIDEKIDGLNTTKGIF
ncbi:MAG TPA: imidazoleglycerol-phosphate dehydratase HisB [bacterium]|nr:imidazoleglycerol-phosphate dehydratase HisB [bacterium]